jgi:hypothetical protein
MGSGGAGVRPEAAPRSPPRQGEAAEGLSRSGPFFAPSCFRARSRTAPATVALHGKQKRVPSRLRARWSAYPGSLVVVVVVPVVPVVSVVPVVVAASNDFDEGRGGRRDPFGVRHHHRDGVLTGAQLFD